MAVVLFLLDAMRYDYISERDTPFLWRCAKHGEYYKHLIPNISFCERTEILTGLNPDKSGFFTAIGYDSLHSPFKEMKWLPLLDILEKFISKKIRIPGSDKSGGLYRFYRRITSRFLQKISKSSMNSYCIPFSLLPYFNLTEDKIDIRYRKSFPTPSILQLLDEEGKSYFYESFTSLSLQLKSSDDERMKLVLNTVSKPNSNYALYLIYIGILDRLGHKYGPESPHIKSALRKIDNNLKKFVDGFESKIPNNQYIFLGDHGMAPITVRFDAKTTLLKSAKRLGLILAKDFIYFLDSTLIRVWFLTEKANKLFPSAIKESDAFNAFGQFICRNLAKKYHIPWMDRRYGDLFWLANPGVLVYPDFFHNDSTAPNGMHGYAPNFMDNHGMCIVCGSNVKKKETDSIPLTKTFYIIKEALKI